mgnify:CR=1 FL=1
MSLRNLALAAVLILAACAPEQLLRAQSYQEKIAAACNVAMSLAPVAGPVAPWIIGGCGAEAMIARLALNPTSLAWVEELILKVRGRA